eukprot:g17815.t1
MPKNRSEAIGPLFSLFVVAAVTVLQPASAQECVPEAEACFLNDATCANCMLKVADEETIMEWAECVRIRSCSILGLEAENCPELEVRAPNDHQPPVPAYFTETEFCAVITAEACCVDDLQLNEDCMGSTAFLEYWDCVADYAGELQNLDWDCPDLTSSCPDVVDVPGGGGEDGGSTTPAPVDVDVPIDTGDGDEDGGSTTPAPTTPAPATPAALATPAPTTPAPVTPASTTPAPATPAALATPAPATPALVAPASTTPAPVTPASTTPAPGTAPPVDNGSGDGDRGMPVESDDPDAGDSTPTGETTTGAGGSSPSAAVTLVVGLAVLALVTFF